jgi:FAD/FMN-containing dehydrogenase
MAIDQLRNDFRGELLVPGDASYLEACQIWNASVVKRPAIVARCAGVADVVAAVKYARAHGLLTAIRGGGHNVGGRALCDDGIVIDLPQLRAVHVDAARRTVRVQGGATLGDLDRETQLFGLAVPTGTVPKTGVAGLTLGGGVGWLVRKFGMTIDNLLSAQVVTADGTVVTANKGENADLYWALRGGGGNFGVVVSLEFQAHPVAMVMGGLLVYPRPMAGAVLRNFREFMKTAPDELTAYAAMLTTPDGMAVVGVIPCYCGDPAEGEKVLAPLRAFGPPVMDAVQLMPFSAMQGLLAPSFPDGNHNYWKAVMMETLSDEAIDVAVGQANAAASPLSIVVMEYYGGAAGRVANDATAFPHRHLLWDVIVLAQWTDVAETAGHREWARATARLLEPFSAKGQLLATMDADAEDTSTAFGSNGARLAGIKKKYDPENFFRVNQNILPG